MPRVWIAVEGGWAGPVTSLKNHVESTNPLRVDVGVRLSEQIWVAPFFGMSKVPGLAPIPIYPAPDGFRLLVGAELQLHSAKANETVDAFGGLGLAFERLVAHDSGEVCGHCGATSGSTIANGANLELRLGVLLRLGRVVQLGPYVGIQVAWMPGLAPVSVVPPDQVAGPGGTFAADVSPVQLWVDLGLRLLVLF